MNKDFDWFLLLRLIALSLASSYEFVYPDPDETDSEDEIDMTIPELIIHVKSGEASISKKVSELWSFQILRLYEIYCCENINYIQIYNDDKLGSSQINREFLEKIADYKSKSDAAKNFAKRRKCFV